MKRNEIQVAVFTLNWNGERLTRRLLQSLADHCPNRDVFVFDNGSDSIPADEFRSDFPGVELVRIIGNYGFAGGVNRAMAHLLAAGFDYAYEINNDCIVASDPIPPLLSALEGHTRAAVVGSRFLPGSEFVARHETGCSLTEKSRGGVMLTRQISGCAMLLDCRVFAEFGGLDERFFCYHEETDFCWRIVEAGREVLYCPDSVVGHFHEGSDKAGNAIYFRTRNWFLLKKKHKKSVLLPYVISIDLPRIWHGFFVKPELWKAWAQGILDGHAGLFSRRGEKRSLLALIATFFFGSIVLFPIVAASCFSELFRRFKTLVKYQPTPATEPSSVE